MTPNPEPYYNIPLYDYPHWHGPGILERLIKRPYNPMQKVVRNIGLLRGNHPMVLVVDDIQKDTAVHHYQWLMQMARDLTIDQYDINLVDSNYKCDIILKEPAATGNRRLLVRVLQNENYTGNTLPGIMDTLDYINYFSGAPFNPNPNFVRPRLIIESNSVSPNFKILLYPYTVGDVLPVTNWNTTKDSLEIVFPNETRIVHFFSDALNNTQFELVNNINLLPVDWLNFTANRLDPAQVQLDWAIEGTTKNEGFVVERMLDRETEFKAIETVVGQGTLGSEYYQLLDDNTYENISYYRIKQVDLDGVTTYSEVRAVKGVERTAALSLFPNPASDVVYLHYKNPLSAEAHIRIYGANGSMVYDRNQLLLPYQPNPIRSIEHLSSGTYWMRISLDGNVERTLKFIKN